MQLADVVAASNAVKATRSRTAKVAVLAELLRAAPPEEVAVVVAFLVGSVRQGRVGVGWSTLQTTSEVTTALNPELTVRDVDTAIDRIEETIGAGSVAARQEVVRQLFVRATADEADFLRRLLLGDLRQGAVEGVMTDAVAAAASVSVAAVRRAAMLAGDLCHVAEVVMQRGGDGLDEIRLQPLRPVLPMLATTSATVGEALAANGRSSVEWKLDGARVQAHRAGDSVRLFTRRLNDVTDRLPGVVDVMRGLAAREVILDGEVFGAAVDDDRADPFQETMSRFSRHDGDPDAGLQVRFFDVVHV
ncbi:MAG: ligase 1, partial [Acidimicrobiaceae bacterium]|nr:ligase 1 [Acidimicrobiaceae bacterium]